MLTWILSIARHKALSALLAQRRRRVAERDDTAMEMVVDSADTPEQTLLNQDCGAQLRTCLAQMSRGTAKSSTSSTITKSPSKRSPA